jgi:hypothetical protein
MSSLKPTTPQEASATEREGIIVKPNSAADGEATAPPVILVVEGEARTSRFSPRKHDEEKVPRMKKGNFPAVVEGGRKKEGMDAKQSRPKADQAVSSVSTAPALVDNIRLAGQLKGSLSLQEMALVYFSDLFCFGGHLKGIAQQRSCASDGAKYIF